MMHTHTVNGIPNPRTFAWACDTHHDHDATHDLDLHIATDANGRIVDFCYDCDAEIVRGPDNLPMGRDAVAESLIRTVAG